MKKLLTSESVTEGHPDKVCDQISDAILDALLEQDPDARVACESTATTGMVFVMGEISTNTYVDIQSIVRNTIEEIGYTSSDYGFDAATCAVITAINEQSTDIAMGVDKALEVRENEEDVDIYDLQGAGDQGMVFGYATNETPEYMPMPLVISHKLAKRLTDVRKEGLLDYLRPDGKSQVTIEYIDGKPTRVDTVLVSTQHDSEATLEQIRKDIIEHVIKPIVGDNLIDENTKYLVNPTGRFVIGGPVGDSGLTGRKIIVDTYGGFSRHGGGAYSGKDPSKVDRSASYMSRFIAKNIVAAGLADKVEIGVAYAIGVAKPVSIYVDSFGTGKLDDDKLTQIVEKEFDLRPKALIEYLDLRKPIYKQTAAYGHFGRDDLDLPWERLTKVNDLKKYLV
ncbi:MAG: methionine adenosyltransferase [Tissierellia bacterium]|nr:methionine adenosyltransferase [Tissierellia bacterium]